MGLLYFFTFIGSGTLRLSRGAAPPAVQNRLCIEAVSVRGRRADQGRQLLPEGGFGRDPIISSNGLALYIRTYPLMLPVVWPSAQVLI